VRCLVEGANFVAVDVIVAALELLDAAFDVTGAFAPERRFFAPEDSVFADGLAAAFVDFFVVFVVNL
jgi:hypothetical protein